MACIPVSTQRQSRAGLARARRLYASRLQGFRIPANPNIVPSHRPAWVRIADPAAEHTCLSTASRANMEWLLQCFQADLACPLRSKPILACKAAADACAEGTKVGIGGWFISSRSVSWFAELGVPRSPAVSFSHKGSPTLHSVLRNTSPARAHAHRLEDKPCMACACLPARIIQLQKQA